MIQAVFLDYTGTIVQERGPEMEAVVGRICRGSRLREPGAVMEAWWGLLKDYEAHSVGDAYLTEDEIVDRALGDFVRDYGLEEDLGELHALIQGFWVNAPLFPDVKAFYESCPVPIYVISNNGAAYVERAMARNGLAPAGIVCADQVRAYKPRREIFDQALAVSGRKADQVVHVGDSRQSDVEGARAAGIRPILLQRFGGAPAGEVTAVRSLLEVLPLLNK